nr:right-handed parallel beta-helix repeat-containing protein [Chloroflexota bacterium]
MSLSHRWARAWLSAPLVLATMVLSAALPVTGASAADASLDIHGPARAQIGHPFVLTLTARDVPLFGGYEGVLSFDPSAVHLSGMAQRGATTLGLGRDVVPLGPEEIDGGVAFGSYTCPARDCVSRTPAGARRAARDLTVARIALTPDRSGTLMFSLSAVKVVDQGGRPLTVRLSTPTISIAVGSDPTIIQAPEAPWRVSSSTRGVARTDLTGDGIATNGDLREVGLDWSLRRLAGDPCLGASESDVNGDGCIDVADVTALAAHLAPEHYGPTAATSGAGGGTGTWLVDTTSDDPDAAIGDGVCATAAARCSLRAAVSESNNHPGADLITFGIGGSAIKRITVGSRIAINDDSGPTTIDGYTQPGSSPNTDPLISNAVIRVELVGTGETNRYPALFVTSADNVIRGLATYRFWRSIQLDGFGADRNLIAGDFIGTDAGGTYFTPSWVQTANGGVLINNGSGNQVGTPALADRNVISGNAASGIYHTHEGTTQNVSRNNIIGLGPRGDRRLGNRLEGWDANLGASFNTAGGTGLRERNVLSGNRRTGAEISHGFGTTGWNGGPTVGNRIIGNLVGTDVTGTRGSVIRFDNGQPVTVDMGNEHFGIHVEDHVQDSEVRHNTVANNRDVGIQIDGFDTTGTIVSDNRVGLGLDGTSLGNRFRGIGVTYHAERILIIGNVVANNPAGIQIRNADDDRVTISRNSIYSNAGLGIDLAPLGSVNPNDDGGVDGGANQRLNYPEIAVATSTAVTGQACPGCTVELFQSDGPAGEYGEGRAFIASTTTAGSGWFTIPGGTLDPDDVVTATTTDGAGNTSEFARNVAVTVDPDSGTVIAADDFGRTRSSGWGSADTGGPWTHTGAIDDYDVDGAQGTMRIPTAGTNRSSTLPGLGATHVDVAGAVTLSELPTGGDAFAYLLARHIDNTREYRAVVRVTPAGAVHVQASGVIDGSTTAIGASVRVDGLTYQADKPLGIRFRVTGSLPTQLQIRVWSGTVEPAGWQVEVSDSVLGPQGPGGAGVRGYLGGSATSAPMSLRWDAFQVKTA